MPINCGNISLAYSDRDVKWPIGSYWVLSLNTKSGKWRLFGLHNNTIAEGVGPSSLKKLTAKQREEIQKMNERKKSVRHANDKGIKSYK
jgi:hypothetical protein